MVTGTRVGKGPNRISLGMATALYINFFCFVNHHIRHAMGLEQAVQGYMAIRLLCNLAQQS